MGMSVCSISGVEAQIECSLEAGVALVSGFVKDDDRCFVRYDDVPPTVCSNCMARERETERETREGLREKEKGG